MVNFYLNHSLVRTTQSTYIPPFNEVGIVVAASVLLPLAVFGIVANLLTIIVIARSKQLTSVFNLFITSLCVSDLISALISPLFLYRRTWGFDEWIISPFMCKFYWGTELWTSYVTSIHILFFALLRYVSVKSPSQYYRIKRIHVKIIISVIWIATFFIGFVPFSIMFTSKIHDRNSSTVDAKWPSCTLSVDWLSDFTRYTVAVYSLFFYIPIIFVILLSIAIVFVLIKKRHSRKAFISSNRAVTGLEKNVPLEIKQQRKERQVMLQLSLIVGSFLVAYLPHTAYHFYTTSTKSILYEDKVFDWWFGLTENFCLRISECLNPIFYNLASSNLRKETIAFLKSCCACKRNDSEVQTSESLPKPKRQSSVPVSKPPADQLEL